MTLFHVSKHAGIGHYVDKIQKVHNLKLFQVSILNVLAVTLLSLAIKLIPEPALAFHSYGVSLAWP